MFKSQHICSECRQLIQEQIPSRQKQLLETYGPNGAVPLLPASQPSAPGLAFGRVDATSPANQQFVEIKNPLNYAVDVSSWKISGSATAELKPGRASMAANQVIWSISEHAIYLAGRLICLLAFSPPKSPLNRVWSRWYQYP